MSTYMLWCIDEKKYAQHNISNIKNKWQIIKCISCGVTIRNKRLSKHASISESLLKEDTLNYNWGKKQKRRANFREEAQKIKQKLGTINQIFKIFYQIGQIFGRQISGVFKWLKTTKKKN